MGKPKRNRSAASKAGSTTSKGRMLEKIVAEMHQQEGAITQTNVHLPPIRNAGGQKREIDVLVTARVVNQEVRIAFECKNERKLTGAQDVDIFARKLEYVGIPVRSGIFVSAAGYTRGAIENAADCGIKLLTYDDLNAKLPETVISAIQSVLYVMCEVMSLHVVSELLPDQSGSAQVVEIAMIYAEVDGQIQQVLVADMLWHQWLVERSLPDTLGIHKIELELPEGAFLMRDGTRYPILTDTEDGPPSVQVAITGFLFNLKGDVTRHQLTNAQTNTLEQFRLSVTFDPKAKPTVKRVTSESELEALRTSGSDVQIVIERFRLPRILFGKAFWPVSQRVIDTLRSRVKEYEAGHGKNPASLTFEDIEGTNLATVWEPISHEWPLYKRYLQGNGPAEDS